MSEKRRRQREIRCDYRGKRVRTRAAAEAAAHQLVTDEDQRKRNNRWRWVLTSGSDDCNKVGLASALRPRLLPFLVHEGGVHALVQELLVKQHAVGELHGGSAQPRC